MFCRQISLPQTQDRISVKSNAKQVPDEIRSEGTCRKQNRFPAAEIPSVSSGDFLSGSLYFEPDLLSSMTRFTADPVAGSRFDLLCHDLRISGKHIGEGISVRRLANEFSMTVPSLDELFQRHLRNTPKRFLIELQLKRAEDLLKQGDLTIAAVAKESGFATLSGFYDFFHKYHNTSPKEWCFKR